MPKVVSSEGSVLFARVDLMDAPKDTYSATSETSEQSQDWLSCLSAKSNACLRRHRLHVLHRIHSKSLHMWRWPLRKEQH